MSKRVAEKVLLVGWDGADWNLIQPLLDQGQLPNVKRLIERGASGKIASIQPMLSPVVWTSMATGKRRSQHGIHGLAEPDPEVGGIRAVSSTSRTTKAIWNILSQSGVAIHVIGWRGAHPAEPINGINVTEQHALAHVEHGKPWPQPEDSIHPPELRETLADLRVHPYQLDRESLAYFFPDIATSDLRDIRRLTTCARWLAASVTNHAVATWAMERRPWEFTAVCYSAIEHLSHAFAPFMAPRQDHISSEDFALYQHVVPACYRFHDLMLGRLLELAGGDSIVVLVSDHGFKSGAMRPARIGRAPEDVELWHRRLGVCMIEGPHVKAGIPLAGASILDITPTILTLFGLPIGMDMDGKPLVGLVDVPVEVDRLASWDQVSGDSGMHVSRASESRDELRAMLAELQELGYRDPAEARHAELEENVIARNRFNLARSLIESGNIDAAREILDELFVKAPQSTSVANMLIEAHLLSGRHSDARAIIECFLPEHADKPLLNLALGRIELAEGRPEAALTYLKRAEEAGAEDLRVYIFRGEAWLCLRRWRDARHAFQQALEVEPDHAESLHGLCITYLREQNAGDAVKYATAAIESYEPMPTAHYHLGMALTKLGRNSEGAAAFERALDLDPHLGAARRCLMRLYDGVLNDSHRAQRHRHRQIELRRERRLLRRGQAGDAE